MAWLADFFRLAGGLLFWNTRKTLYRLRGARGHCPCQHPSDSGKAWETGCNAIIHWNQPARFQRVCHLLKKDASDRWRCSVNQTDVRPFWGRAFAFYGGGLAILYLAGTLTAFTALRAIGYQVTYPGVVWPPAWEKFAGVKSEFFFVKFHRAYAAQDIREALMDLSLAYDLDPKNYDAGLSFALLCQVGQPGLSDRVYRRLLVEHPERAPQTAQAFFRALLARGDFQSVQTLARDRILSAPASSAPWLNAFLFANRRTDDTETLNSFAEDPRIRQLPSDVQTVLSLAVSIRKAKSPDDARQLLLTRAGQGAAGYTLYFICRQLISHNFPQAALGLLDQPDTGLSMRDRTALRLDALAAQGWNTSLNKQFDLLLEPPLTPAVIELLGTHLIRYPDADLLDKLFGHLQKSPIPHDEINYAAYLVFFCATGVAHDEAKLDWSVIRLKEILGSQFTSLDAVGAFFMGKNKNGHFSNYLPALQPLPLETTYALFSRYSPVPPNPGRPQ